MGLLSLLGDLIMTNILLIVCSLPIITAGPALTAASKVMYDITEHQCNSVVKTFLEAFRQNFRKSLLVWLGALAVVLMLFVQYTMAASCTGKTLQTILIYIFYISSALLVALLSYLFPLIMRYENSTKEHLQNALLLSIGQLPYTLLLTILNALPFVLLIQFTPIFFYLLPVWVLLGFALILFLNICILRRLFRKLEQHLPAKQ